MYRPFNRQWLWADPDLIESAGKMLRVFPTAGHGNFGFYQVGKGSAVPFSVLMLDALPNLHVTGAGSGGQFFPRYTWQPLDDTTDDAGQGVLRLGESMPAGRADVDDQVVLDGYRRVDNITDVALREYQAAYGTDVTKDDIFYYIYGLLHSPDYRSEFAADLKKMLPRIPLVDTRTAFDAFVQAGRDLAALHVGYEDVEPWPGLTIEGVEPPAGADPYDCYHVTKMDYAGKRGHKDRTQVLYNPHITVRGIPEEAQTYMLGARSAIDWILERYRIKTDKPSGITNDPNAWSREHHQPRYILDLLTKIVTVSMRTVEIVNSLPPLTFDEAGAHAA